MVSGDFTRLNLKLLQAVNLVVKELFNGPMVDPFQLVQNIEHHFELASGHVTLTDHLLQLLQCSFTVFALTFAFFEEFLERLLVLLKRILDVFSVFNFRNVHHRSRCEFDFTSSFDYLSDVFFGSNVRLLGSDCVQVLPWLDFEASRLLSRQERIVRTFDHGKGHCSRRGTVPWLRPRIHTTCARLCDEELSLSIHRTTPHLSFLLLLLVVENVVHFVVDHVVAELVTLLMLKLVGDSASAQASLT